MFLTYMGISTNFKRNTMEPKFTISEAVSTCWKCLKEQIWVLVGLLIGFMILSMVISMLSMGSMTMAFVMMIPSLAISILFMLGYTRNLFQALDGDEPQFSAYGQESRKFLNLLVAYLLFSIIVGIGMVLLVVPGIYLALRLQFCLQAIVEEDAGIIESLQRSWEITQGQVWQLFLLALVCIGISILGLIVLGVGIFVAYPLIMMISCYVFRRLVRPTVAIEESEIATTI